MHKNSHFSDKEGKKSDTESEGIDADILWLIIIITSVPVPITEPEKPQSHEGGRQERGDAEKSGRWERTKSMHNNITHTSMLIACTYCIHTKTKIVPQRSRRLGWKSKIMVIKRTREEITLKMDAFIECCFAVGACEVCAWGLCVRVFCRGKQTQAVTKSPLPLAVPLCLPPGCHHIKRQPHISQRHSAGEPHRTLTGPALDASLGARHGEDGEAVVVLGAAGLDGTHVAVAAGAEHAGKIQGLDGLRLHLPEHGLTHWLELTVQRVSQLKEERHTAVV